MFIQIHPLKDFWTVKPESVLYINKNNISRLSNSKSSDGEEVWHIWLIGDVIPVTIALDEFLKFNLL